MHFKVRRSAAAALHVGYLIFPQISTILSNPTPPQTLSLGQLKPHCVNPATSIRITNKLSLTVITIVLPCPLIVRAHLQPASAPPHLCVLRELCVEIPPSLVYLHLVLLGIPAPRLYAFSEASVPKSFVISTHKMLSFCTILVHSKSFSCNTYESPRKCCKQKTYGVVNPFSCNTYKKQGVHPFKPKALPSSILFPSSLLPVPLFPLFSLSCSYTHATADPQLFWNQFVTPSFLHDGGCTTPSVHSSLRSSAHSASLRCPFRPLKQMSFQPVLTVEWGCRYGWKLPTGSAWRVAHAEEEPWVHLRG